MSRPSDTRSETDVRRVIHAAIDRGALLDSLTGLEELIQRRRRREDTAAVYRAESCRPVCNARCCEGCQ